MVAAARVRKAKAKGVRAIISERMAGKNYDKIVRLLPVAVALAYVFVPALLLLTVARNWRRLVLWIL